MKTKLTIILGKIDKKFDFFSDSYFKLYLDDNNQLPARYVTQSGIDNCIKQIFSDYFKIDSSWPSVKISNARTKMENGTLCTEILYTCFIPSIWGIEKTGTFYTIKKLKELSIEIDPFYEKTISKQSRSIYR
jgi:hypothetical protein